MTHSQQMYTQDNNKTFFYAIGYDSPVNKFLLARTGPNVMSVDVEQGYS